MYVSVSHRFLLPPSSSRLLWLGRGFDRPGSSQRVGPEQHHILFWDCWCRNRFVLGFSLSSVLSGSTGRLHLSLQFFLQRLWLFTHNQNIPSVSESTSSTQRPWALVSFLLRKHFWASCLGHMVFRSVLLSSPCFPWALPWRVWLPVYSSLHPSGSPLPPPLPRSLN